jgi:hypothetical protein
MSAEEFLKLHGQLPPIRFNGTHYECNCWFHPVDIYGIDEDLNKLFAYISAEILAGKKGDS